MNAFCKIPSFFYSGFNMGISVHWSWLAALSCLLCMGGEVLCNCTETNMQIEGGDYKLTKQLQTGSLLIYNCPEGFYPYPHLHRLCQADDTWRPLPKRFSPQRCRVVECPDPTVMDNGDVSPPQERYFVNNETTYECYSGYTLRGSSRRVCLPNGKWSGSTPICSRDSGDVCADPGIPAGATRTGNMFRIDDSVTYTCNGKLILVGSKDRVCQENGQWSGKEPACYFTYAYDTSLEVTQAFGSAIKDSLTTLESTNDTLNIYIGVDISESIDEEHIDNARKAITKLISKISYFSASPNYEIVFFSSEIFEIVSILNFFNKKAELRDIVADIDNFVVGDKRSGTDLDRLFTTFLEKMSVIKQRVGDENFKDHRHVLIVFTDGAYNMGGSPSQTVEKIKNMVYMEQTTAGETPPRADYLDIYIFGIGAEIFDDDLQPLTVGTGGNHYFRMQSIEGLDETFDDIIDEEEVIGLCGLHKEYDRPEEHRDRDSRMKIYPWVAFIHVQADGTPRKCLGSLVSPQFVLTAAHCFPFGVLPQNITVEIDDGQGKVKKVKTFKLHEKYNITAKTDKGVKEYYDYDVALVQLEKDVQISAAVRPICIPCTAETSGALKLVGNATCRTQEQLLLKTHLERLTFLTESKHHFVDEKDVSAKLGNNRGECIKHALTAEGVTTKNLSDVVTDNFLCTGGRIPNRDHISCPGDGGGAVFKNYGHRTIQVAVVSWGTKNLCTRSRLVESDATSRDFHINLFRVVPFLKSILGNDNQDEYAPLQFLDN